jgi:hypothetical protein
MAIGRACNGRACRAVTRVARSAGGIDDAVRVQVLVGLVLVMECELGLCWR